MGTAIVDLPDGRRARVEFDSQEQLDAAVNELTAGQAKQEQPAPQVAPKQGSWTDYVPPSPMSPGGAEAMLHFSSGLVAPIAAGYAGLAQGAYNALGGNGMQAGDRVRQVQDTLTYQPKTQGGQAFTRPATYLMGKYGEGADWAGDKTRQGAQALGASPEVAGAAGATVSTGIQLAPALLLAKRGKGTEGTSPDPAAAAEAYVRSNTSLDWTALPDAFKAQLTDIAKSSTDLSRLDPAAIERQGRMASVGVKGTRGQVTRDATQLRNEANVSQTTAGLPLRDIYTAQNRTLYDNLQTLKDQTGSQAGNASAVGESVQGAARAKLEVQKGRVDRLYKAADRSTETLQPVDATPVIDLVSRPEIAHNYGYAKAWLNRMGLEPGQGVSIRELENLRKLATNEAKDGGTKGFYAGELVKHIDAATEGAGGRLYKAARSARKAQGLEFQDQAGVARLVSDKTRTDRQVALEATWDKTIKNGSIEDVQKVRKSLTTGGTPRTRALGEQAWRDLQGQTMQHIIEKATRSTQPLADGTPNITPAGLRAGIESIGKAKIDIQFGEGTYAKLDTLLRVTEDVKTLPPMPPVGSSTVANTLAAMERILLKVPVAGRIVDTVVRGGTSIYKAGENSRAAAAAIKDPLAERASGVNSLMNKQRASENALATATAAETSNKRK